MIRPATGADLVRLQEIERAAGRVFADIGMTAIADDDPPTLGELREFQQDGRAWVHAVDGNPTAYLLVRTVDEGAHIEQVSVHPDFARRGVGRGLIDHADQWAQAERLPALTLTTFTEVPWNGPYYLRCGFRYLTDTELGPGLQRIRADEGARGLDAWPRACMRRETRRPEATAGEAD